MGEPFEAVLTCAALETASTKVVVDRSRLDPTVIALPPFDVLGGDDGRGREHRVPPLLPVHLPDAAAERHGVRPGRVARRPAAHLPDRHADQRRHDVAGTRPELRACRRCRCGCCRSCPAPPATSATPARSPSPTSRRAASGPGPSASSAGCSTPWAAAVAALALVRAYGRSAHRPGRDRRWSRAAPSCSRPAASCRRSTAPRQSEGWTDALLARAAAAMRIVGGYAIGKPAAQGSGRAAQALDGQIALTQGLLRRRHALVSSPVTPERPGAGGRGQWRRCSGCATASPR